MQPVQSCLLAFLQKFMQCYTPEIFKSCSFQGFLACLQCIKPNTVFKIIFSFDVNQQSKKHKNKETQYEFVSQWHNFLFDLDKPFRHWGLNPSVPPRDPTTGQTHQRLKVNSGANQFSSLKHSSSASHCAITAQAYTHTYICTHMVNPHPSCYGGHDPMYQHHKRNEGADAWPLKSKMIIFSRPRMTYVKFYIYGWGIYRKNFTFCNS